MLNIFISVTLISTKKIFLFVSTNPQIANSLQMVNLCRREKHLLKLIATKSLNNMYMLLSCHRQYQNLILQDKSLIQAD